MSDKRVEVDVEAVSYAAIEDLKNWLQGKRNKNGKVDTNVLCAGLYVTEHLNFKFPLEEGDYLTSSQVKGSGGEQAKTILFRHGEDRPFLREGGRTSRNTRSTAIEIVELLKDGSYSAELTRAADDELRAIAWRLQSWFVRQIQEEYFAKERLKADISHGKPVRLAVEALLVAARSRGGNTAGAVAQHLVGAKLELRFPEELITRQSYTTADQQTERPGDFHIGDTAIHVTMSPVPQLFLGRCADNIRQGFRSRVLVPENKLAAAREMSDDDRIAVQSVEDFIGTNIEEMAGFGDQRIKSNLRLLLERYNEIVGMIESDPSLLIEIPANL